jgi:hypothetical protein
VLRGAEVFGYRAADDQTDADSARSKTETFLAAISGAAVATTDPARTGVSAGAGLNLQSSTLLSEDTGVPFDQLQAEQIRLHREA